MNRQVLCGIGLICTIAGALLFTGAGRSDSTSASAAPAAPAASSDVERAEALLLELSNVEAELNAATGAADQDSQSADTGVIAKLNESARLNADISRQASERNKEIEAAQVAALNNVSTTRHFQVETAATADSANAKQAEIQAFEKKLEEASVALAACQSLKGRLESQLAQQEKELSALDGKIAADSKTAAHLRKRCTEVRADIDKLVKVIPKLEAEEKSLKKELAKKRLRELMRNGPWNFPGIRS